MTRYLPNVTAAVAAVIIAMTSLSAVTSVPLDPQFAVAAVAAPVLA